MIIGNKAQNVLNALRTLENANSRMISHYLSSTVNKTTGFIVQLKSEKYVEKSHEATCPFSGNNSIYWKLTDLGYKNSKPMKDPIAEQTEPIPYIMIEGYETDRFEARYKAKSQKKPYNTWIKVYPDGKMDFGCDCYDSVNIKQGSEPCKHCRNLRNNALENKDIEGNTYFNTKEVNNGQ